MTRETSLDWATYLKVFYEITTLTPIQKVPVTDALHFAGFT